MVWCCEMLELLNRYPQVLSTAPRQLRQTEDDEADRHCTRNTGQLHSDSNLLSGTALGNWRGKQHDP